MLTLKPTINYYSFMKKSLNSTKIAKKRDRSQLHNIDATNLFPDSPSLLISQHDIFRIFQV